MGDVEEMKTENFESLLIKFEETLKRYNPRNYEKLQPPLPEQQLNYHLDKLHLNYPEMKLLFGWRNGVNLSKGVYKSDKIFKMGTLLSLEDMVLSSEEFPHENPHLIPLVRDIAGEGLLINNEAGKDYGRIYLDSVSLLSLDDPYSCYDSIYSLLKTTIEAYETQALKYDYEEDYLDSDTSKFWEIAKELNPQSSYWKLE